MAADLALLATLAGLLLVAATALTVGRVGAQLVPARSLARAALQLSVVSLVIRLAFASAAVAGVFVLVMLGAVALTAGRRLGPSWRHVGLVLAAATAGSAPVLLLLLAPGAFPRTPRYVISFAGIVLGGTMTACTLSGRRLRDRVSDRWPEVEAWLSLGASNREAVLPFVPAAVLETLLPAFDQTRTTGLVTLPGAFVGSLAGGASPWEAAKFQLAVLAGLLAAQAVAAVLLLHLLAPELAVAPGEN